MRLALATLYGVLLLTLFFLGGVIVLPAYALSELCTRYTAWLQREVERVARIIDEMDSK